MAGPAGDRRTRKSATDRQGRQALLRELKRWRGAPRSPNTADPPMPG